MIYCHINAEPSTVDPLGLCHFKVSQESLHARITDPVKQLELNRLIDNRRVGVVAVRKIIQLVGERGTYHITCNFRKRSGTCLLLFFECHTNSQGCSS